MTWFLLLGDLHLADRPPSACSESYLDDLFDLLGQAAEVAASYDAVVVQAGDTFHLKQPSRNSHALVQRTIDAFRKFPREVYVVPGNHDLANDVLGSVWTTQPLGVVFKSGAAQMLHGWADGYPVFGVPWLQRFTGPTVMHALQDYRSAATDVPTLVVTHAPLYPPGQELEYEFYPSQDWADAMANRGSTYYGHVHEAHGTWSSGGVTFCNQGALSRGSLHEHNLSRAVAATLWNDVNGEFARVDLPHRPSGEVFRLEQAAKVRASKDDLASFLTSVGRVSLQRTSVEDVIAHVRDLGLDKDLTALVEELLRRR